MADRTIKPDSGNDLVLQNNDASAKIEINADSTVKVTADSNTAIEIKATRDIDFSASGDATYFFGSNRPATNTTKINATADSVLQLQETESTKVQLHSSGDSYFNGGNLGIGITDPASNDGWGKTLEVGGTTGGELSLNHSDASATQGIGQVSFTRDSATLASVNGVTGSTTGKGELNFRTHNGTSNATRMTVEEDGDVTIEDGDLVVGTAGHGITFGGNPDNRQGSPTVDSSRTLYDYETGTFDLTISSSGYSFGSYTSHEDCKYTKIGRKVFVQGKAKFSAIGSTTSYVDLGNLPFTCSSTQIGTGVAIEVAVSTATYSCHNIQGTNRFYITSRAGSSNGSTRTLQANNNFNWSLTYTV